MRNNNVTCSHIIQLIIFMFILVAPITLTSQKLNVVRVRLGQKLEPFASVKGEDTVKRMNDAILHQIFVKRYGKDKYYNVLKALKTKRTTLRLHILLKNGYIDDWRLCLPQHHQFYYELMEDTTFAEKLVEDIQQSLIFASPLLNIYNDMDDSRDLFEIIRYDLYYFEKDIDILSKEEFLRVQTDRLDSILTKTHLRYSKYSRYNNPQIFDTDEYPLFNDSVTPIVVK